MPPRAKKAVRATEAARDVADSSIERMEDAEAPCPEPARWGSPGRGGSAGPAQVATRGGACPEVEHELSHQAELADRLRVAAISPDRGELPASDCSSSHLEDGGELPASDVHADRRLMGAAATVAGATGMMLMGPVSGATLGAAAMYVATKEGSAGQFTRKVGSVSLHIQDRAIDGCLQALDEGAKKVGVAVERLSKEVDLSSMPAPVRSGVAAVLSGHSRPAQKAGVSSEDAQRIRNKYPDRVPVICERSPFSTGIPAMAKKKFIVPGAMLCGEFKYMIHKQLAQALAGSRGAEQTIYVFVNGLAPKTSTPMSDLYDKFRADDGFLYIKYGAENTLGY